MIKIVRCCNCKKEKEFDTINMGNYEKNGFQFVWDVSNGLSPIPICNKCAAQLKEHLRAIENLCGISIKYLNFDCINLDKLESIEVKEIDGIYYAE